MNIYSKIMTLCTLTLSFSGFAVSPIDLSQHDIEKIHYELNKFKLEKSAQLFHELKQKSASLKPLIEQKTKEIQNILQMDVFSYGISEKLEKENIKPAIKHLEDLANLLKNKQQIPQNILREAIKKEIIEYNEVPEVIVSEKPDEIIAEINEVLQMSCEEILQEKILEDVNKIIQQAKLTKEFQEHQKNPGMHTEYELYHQIKRYAANITEYNSNLLKQYEDSFRESKNDEYLKKIENIYRMQSYFIICMKALEKDHLNMGGQCLTDYIFSSYTPH